MAYRCEKRVLFAVDLDKLIDGTGRLFLLSQLSSSCVIDRSLTVAALAEAWGMTVQALDKLVWQFLSRPRPEGIRRESFSKGDPEPRLHRWLGPHTL